MGAARVISSGDGLRGGEGGGADGLATAGSARSELGVCGDGRTAASGSESHGRVYVDPTARAPSRSTIAPVWISMVPSDGPALLHGEVVIASTFGRSARRLRVEWSTARETPDVIVATQPSEAFPYPRAT